MTNFLNRLFQLIDNNKKRAFIISFTALIATGLLMRPSSACLITPETPMAIVALELAFDQQRAVLIKEVWSNNMCPSILSLSSNGLEAATINIFFDFPFIIGYTSFFIVLVCLSQRRVIPSSGKGVLRLGFVVVFIAGLDVIENIFMLIFLKMETLSSYLFAFPATIKFGLILLLILVLAFRFGAKILDALKT